MPKNVCGGKKHKSSKNKQPQLEERRRLILPNSEENQVLAIIRQRLGGSRVLVDCDDHRSRSAIISGKFKKKVWMKADDIVICEVGTTGKDNECTIVHKYTDSEVLTLKSEDFDWLAFTRNPNEDILVDMIVYKQKEFKGKKEMEVVLDEL